MDTLCRLDDLAGVEARGFAAAIPDCDHGFFIVPRGGMFYGYLNSCPHRQLPLNWLPDRFMDHTGAYIQCANHGALFDVVDGRCVAGPCIGSGLTPVRLIRIGDEIRLDEPAPTPPAAV